MARIRDFYPCLQQQRADAPICIRRRETQVIFRFIDHEETAFVSAEGVLTGGIRNAQIAVHRLDGNIEAECDLGDVLPLVMKLVDLL